MEKLNITKATDKDIDTLKAIELECFGSPEENFKFVLNNDNYLYLIAWLNDKAVGYIGVSISFEESDLLYICISKEYRNKGYAILLYNKMVDILKQKGVNTILLEVNQNNTSAINLYKKLGFNELTLRQNYYGQDAAIIMTKNI